MLSEMIEIVIDAALADGMDPDVKSLSLEVGEDGGVTIKSTSGAGVEYANDLAAEDLAAALDLESAAPAEESEPAAAEVAA